MTIKTGNVGPGHDHIVDRAVRTAQVGRPSRIMTDHTASLMQGQDTIGTGPGVGEQRIGRAGPSSSMAFVTVSAILYSVGSSHLDIVTRSMGVAVESAGMAFRAQMRDGTQSRINRRSDQRGSALTTLMTLAAVVAVDTGYDLTLRSRQAGASYTMAGATGRRRRRRRPIKRSVTLDVTGMPNISPVGMAVQAGNRRAGHDYVVHRREADADIVRAGGVMTQTAVALM